MVFFPIRLIYLNGTKLLLHYGENLWGKLMGKINGENSWGKFREIVQLSSEVKLSS